MTGEPNPIDDELSRMTGNPKVAQAIKESLHKLSKGSGGPELAEMADDLLAGRTSLRQVGSSSVYAAQFAEAARRYNKWLTDLTPEERADLNRRNQEALGDPAEE